MNLEITIVSNKSYKSTFELIEAKIILTESVRSPRSLQPWYYDANANVEQTRQMYIVGGKQTSTSFTLHDGGRRRRLQPADSEAAGIG